MPRRKSEGQEFERLRRAGLELRPPVDEFSEQPASGSAIGGRRGAQEYGIQGGRAQEDGHDRDLGSNVDANTSDIEEEGHLFPRDSMDRTFPGISDYTRAHLNASEDVDAVISEAESAQEENIENADEAALSIPELESLLRDRLARHPELQRHEADLSIALRPEGELLLQGRVDSEAMRLLVQEMAEAVVGERVQIRNQIEVQTHPVSL